MKKIYKIFVIMYIVLIVIAFLTNASVAMTINDLDAPASYIFWGTGNNIVQVLTTIGSIVSVIVLVLIGIKYMLGSVEEKAEYKKSMLPYVIGSLCVFGASGIAKLIYDIAMQL